MLRAAVFAFVFVVLAGCGAATVSSPALPPDAASLAKRTKPATLCIKLTDGDPSVRAGTVCAGLPYKHEVNSSVCYPTMANPCVSTPKTATVQLTEKGYKGPIIVGIESKKLPKAVLQNPSYPGALCDDEGTASYSEDVLRVDPKRGAGPKRSFTVTDDGPRSVGSSVEISSDCNIIFYDKSNHVVPFSIIMLTVPGLK
jgi:hypothetical protein